MSAKRRALASRREIVGHTQETLAEFVGVGPVTVGRWERGETSPQPWCRPRLAEGLTVSVEELDRMLAEGQPVKGTISAVAALGAASPKPDQADSASLASYVREQWSIESLHGIRDTLYHEDKSQIKTRSGSRTHIMILERPWRRDQPRDGAASLRSRLLYPGCCGRYGNKGRR